MKFPRPLLLSEIAAMIGAEIIGNPDALVLGINEIHRVETGDLVFVDHPKYYQSCLLSPATYIIIDTKSVEIPPGKSLLVTKSPFEAYQTIAARFRPFEPTSQAISPTARIGKGTHILPGAFVGNHVTIGEDCIIGPNVSIMDHCQIGNNVVIQAGTVIGGDAFYYNTKKNRELWYKKMYSCGDVVIEDDVEIGCNCTIDRGVSSPTRIGRGTKMDNQVHIAHDVVIGKNCLLAAQVGIAGATTLEDNVTIWGQTGVNKTLTIGKGAVVMARSGVNKTIEGAKIYWGSPVVPIKEKQKELVWIKRIPDLWKTVKGDEMPPPNEDAL